MPEAEMVERVPWSKRKVLFFVVGLLLLALAAIPKKSFAAWYDPTSWPTDVAEAIKWGALFIIENIGEAVRVVLSAIIFTLFKLTKALVLGILAAVLTMFPSMAGYVSSAVSTFATYSVYMTAVNAWFPLDLAFPLLGLFYGFLAVWVPVRFILKHLPFIGG